MTRSFNLPLLLTGALGLGLFVGCGDKTDDTGTATGTGTTLSDEICDDGIDNDGDGDVDGDDSDCAAVESDCSNGTDDDGDGDIDCDDSDCDGDSACTFFVPTSLLFSVTTGLKDGMQYDVTSGGTAVGHYFSILLINDDWAGADDTRNYCQVVFDVTAADVATDCADCWAGAAWTVDTSTLVGTDGECDSMDPAAWSDDVASYFAGFSYGYGFGSMTTEFHDTVQTAYADYWDEYGSYFFSNYIMTDLAGSTDWLEFNYTMAYEYDATTGELSTDSSSGYLVPIDVTDATFAPDGYYQSGYFYGYTL